jgi:hypothetical protein
MKLSRGEQVFISCIGLEQEPQGNLSFNPCGSDDPAFRGTTYGIYFLVSPSHRRLYGAMGTRTNQANPK